MIEATQKRLVHEYARAARMEEATYRNYVRSEAGVSSVGDPRMSQAGFERLMARLEEFLFQQVDAGKVPDPIGVHRRIRDRFHWRNRLPRDGGINSRQAYMIQERWTRLSSFLPEDKRTIDYLAGIVRRATWRPVDNNPSTWHLTATEADKILDALQDRLSYLENRSGVCAGEQVESLQRLEPTDEGPSITLPGLPASMASHTYGKIT